MKKVAASGLTAFLLGLTAVPGWAVPEHKVEELRQKQSRIASNAASPGKKRMLYKKLNRRIDHLLERLERGEQVDVSEIDALMRQKP